jgi:hypothetical protein
LIIQLNTDKNIAGDERLESYLNTIIKDELSNFSDNITRIEVHLADANEASIYAKAYDKSIQTKSLYGFLKSRGTFEKTFDGKTSIFISTDCELYKYLKKMERRFIKKQIDDHIFLN